MIFTQILKKFKKDLNIEEEKPEERTLSDEELMVKAQEKFEELKQNVQNNQEESLEDIVLELEQNNTQQEDDRNI